MQSVLIVECFICKVSLVLSALYAKCTYYSVLYMQSVLIFSCFICNPAQVVLLKEVVENGVPALLYEPACLPSCVNAVYILPCELQRVCGLHLVNDLAISKTHFGGIMSLSR